MTTEIERRRRVRARLSRVRGKLGELEVRLEALHADLSGAAALLYKPPLIPDEAQYVGASVDRIAREAVDGCDLSAQWMEDTDKQRARIEHLRATPLQPRAPGHDGPWLTPRHAQRMGKVPRFRHYNHRPAEELAAAHCARVQARKERGRALMADVFGEDAIAARLPE